MDPRGSPERTGSRVKIQFYYSSIFQKRVGCCWHVLIREGILKLRLTEGRSSKPFGHIEIKVPCENNRQLRIVPLGIIESLPKLSAA
jgi:hypothetical protein